MSNTSQTSADSAPMQSDLSPIRCATLQPRFFAVLIALLLPSMLVQAQMMGPSGKAVKLDTTVNSPYEEIMPLLGPDRTTLYFVRSLSPANTGGKEAGQDVWFATQQADKSWSRAMNMGVPIDNEADNAICGISPDGNTIYLTNLYQRRRMEPGVSFSTRTGGTWSVPTPIELIDFTIQRGYLGAYMMPDGKMLFLSMKSDESVGREDLYVSFRQADGKYSKPQNMGKVLNTVGFETSPFYSERDSILYFASNGHGGYGDADIYRAKRKDNTFTQWSKPENMGPQVNSDGFDAYLNVAYDSTAFFVKEDPELRYANIYQVTLQDPQRNKEANDSSLVSARRKKEKKAREEEEDRKKKFGTDRDPRSPEEIYKDMVNRRRLTNSEFESILFDFGQSKLRNEGRTILDKAVAYLKSHPTQAIELVGHTDSVSGDMVNQILSDKRSYAAKEYLMKKGISRNRILNHGFGKQIFVAENETDRGRQRNRRCEMNLLIDPEEFRTYYQKERADVTPQK
jgi:OmpA-OmpF porin, OOP family